MAYNGVIVTEAEMQFMAGENVDATGDNEDNHNYLAEYAEAYLCNLVKYDIVTNWASLTTIYKQLFTEWAARYAGMQLIAYNMAGYTSRQEAEDMIDIHAWRMNLIESILKDASVSDFQGV